MDLLKSEMDSDFDAVGFKNMRRNLKPSGYQTGKSNKIIDASRHALQPGKRLSKTGKIYYENRKSRSDLKNSSI
jgi:hypothetical protein